MASGIGRDFRDRILAMLRDDGKFLSLHSGDPLAGNEITGNGPCRRQPIEWDAMAGAALATKNAQHFRELPAGEVVACGIWDQPTGGSLLWFGDVEEAREMRAGDQYLLDVGEVVVELGSGR